MNPPKILQVGYLPEHDFWRYLAATDLCVNLRYPTAGETSGIAIRMMGMGKAVAFTEGEEIARLPENACLRIPVGAAEEETLAAMIVWLAEEFEAAREIGWRAARHVESAHSLERVAELYWEAIAKTQESGVGSQDSE